jgi:DivIVA domain-containing protein
MAAGSGTIGGVYPLLVIAALAVVFVVAAVASGRGDLMADAPVDLRALDLPEAPLQPADLAGLRFAVGLRGYRMDQVDQVLDRVAAELASRDERIAALEADLEASRSAGEGEPPDERDQLSEIDERDR